MCIKDDGIDDPGRRAFVAASLAAAVVAGTASTGAEAQAGTAPAAPPPPPPPPTRVLDDPRVEHGPISILHNGQASIGGYLARPKAEGRYPPVLVIAGNRISEEYIPNTCAALALGGFVGLAPDIFHILPDTARTLDEMRAAGAKHSDSDVTNDIQAGIEHLRTLSFVREGGIGLVGFCYGGRMAMLLGARSREVDAVIAYHPGKVTQAEVKRLSCPVQIHCGTADGNVPVADVKALEAMLKAQGTPTELHLYEGADHGFLAYTRPPRYDPAAGKLSWERSLSFLRERLA